MVIGLSSRLVRKGWIELVPAAKERLLVILETVIISTQLKYVFVVKNQEEQRWRM